MGVFSFTNLLKPGRTQSRLVFRVIRLWKWQYVMDEENTLVVVDHVDAYKRIQRSLPNLSAANAENIADLVESLAKRG